MPTYYLLPCECGQKTEVDASQAGLNVRCGCGAELAVPTMRGLSALERVEAPPDVAAAQPASAWGPRQGLLFLGGAILTFAALGALYFWWSMPAPPSLFPDYQEYNRNYIDQKSPEELLDIWHECRTGITQPMWEAQLDAYDRLVGDLMQWEMLVGGVAALGLAVVVAGLLTPRRRG